MSGKILGTWILGLFAVVIMTFNGMMSFAFGQAYLGAAFGLEFWLAGIIAGAYALLIADVAYVVWFYVYRKVAETTVQRVLALVVGIVSLSLSIAMTVNQLTMHSYGLVNLTAYQQSVGFAALGAMIVVTTLHIAGLAVFVLQAADEKVKSKALDIRAKLIDDSMRGVEDSMPEMKADLVEALQSVVKERVFNETANLLSDAVDYQDYSSFAGTGSGKKKKKKSKVNPISPNGR